MYNKQFYEQYSTYLYEPSVRKSHDWVLNVLKFDGAFDYVLDLGSGVGEFKKFYKPKGYLGVDANCEESFNTRKANYRTCDFKKELRGYKPTSFVSLFSTEITAPTAENYMLYEKLFSELKIISGLVSGFYYASKKLENIVQETAGITSYQCLENLEDVRSELFTEKRIILPVPSKMFGSDVVEVWKLLTKVS